jgi:hypothetical protein
MNLPWTFLLHSTNYAEAEAWANQYKGETQTDKPVSVVIDLWKEENSPKRFTVIAGTIFDSERFVVLYTA